MGVKKVGGVVYGDLYYHGWLKLSVEHHGAGWVKRAHAPFGTLVQPEKSETLSQSAGGAATEAAVARLVSEETLTEEERRELREMLLPPHHPGGCVAAPGRDAAAGLDGSRWLLLQPYLGLCNRLRALVAAINLCRTVRRVLLLQWYPDSSSNGCNVAFGELFRPHAEVRMWPLVAPPPRGSKYLNVNHPSEWLPAATYLGKGLPQTAMHAAHAVAAGGNSARWQLLDDLATARCLVLHTCSDFFPVDGMDSMSNNAARPITRAASEARGAVLRSLQPTEQVRAMLDELPDRAGLVGVHVRRTDNMYSTGKSPLSMFVRTMDAVVAREPGTLFFLATDCEATERTLKARYGSKILRQRSVVRNRNTVAGMRAALVDLLSLAQCREILGSFYSSFSIMSSTIPGIPLQIMLEDDEYHDAL